MPAPLRLAPNLLAAPGRTDSAEVAATLSPEPLNVLNTDGERQRQAVGCVRAGHAANRDGRTAEAAARFFEAYRLEPQRTSSLLSHLSMRLKMGHAELAVACYLQLLETADLSDRECACAPYGLSARARPPPHARHPHPDPHAGGNTSAASCVRPTSASPRPSRPAPQPSSSRASAAPASRAPILCESSSGMRPPLDLRAEGPQGGSSSPLAAASRRDPSIASGVSNETLTLTIPQARRRLLPRPCVP